MGDTPSSSLYLWQLLVNVSSNVYVSGSSCKRAMRREGWGYVQRGGKAGPNGKTFDLIERGGVGMKEVQVVV